MARKDENKMQGDEETVAVLLRIPKTLYKEYLQVLDRKALKRQRYSSELFCKAIKEELNQE